MSSCGAVVAAECCWLQLLAETVSAKVANFIQSLSQPDAAMIGPYIHHATDDRCVAATVSATVVYTRRLTLRPVYIVARHLTATHLLPLNPLHSVGRFGFRFVP